MSNALRTQDAGEPTASHQTVRLGRGRHSAPGTEVCVMELASMLAGEPFSDHPRSVCPVLGALLRAYNDHVDDDRRQSLYALAATVVGTRGSAALEERRARAILEWCALRDAARPFWSRRLRPIALDLPPKSFYLHASAVIRCLPRRISDRAHLDVVELVERLVALAADERAAQRTQRQPASRQADPSKCCATSPG